MKKDVERSGREPQEAGPRAGIFSLRRLRWKLTLSYTLVTVLALLLAELAILSLILGVLASPLTPRLIAEEAEGRLSPRLAPALAESPPDTGEIRRELSDSPADPESDNFTPALPPENGYLFVVDGDRRLIAANQALPKTAEGEPLERGVFPELDPLLDETLGDGDDPWRQGAYSSDWRRLLISAPVEGEDGATLGAVGAVVRLPNLAAPLLIVAGVGAILLLAPAALLGTAFGLVTAWSLTRRLQRLAGAAQAWSRGDFSAVARDRSRDELGQLSRELNRMARELETLIQTRGELAALETRNRFARELHDSVKQQVFATSLQIAAARNLVDRDSQGAARHLEQADELVRQAQRELNGLIQEMRPAALADKGLAAAVRDYAESWSRGSEIPATVRVRGERETPLEVEQAVFRVLQEALANAARHSRAAAVEVDLSWEPENVRLAVTDDGAGFVPGSPGDGFGLESMHERVAATGGRLEVHSEPGEGTRVECVCPLRVGRRGAG